VLVRRCCAACAARSSARAAHSGASIWASTPEPRRPSSQPQPSLSEGGSRTVADSVRIWAVDAFTSRGRGRSRGRSRWWRRPPVAACDGRSGRSPLGLAGQMRNGPFSPCVRRPWPVVRPRERERDGCYPLPRSRLSVDAKLDQ
jgi:hypothetical protein